MEIRKIREYRELADQAAVWFHSKWGVPTEAYRESIHDCLTQKKRVPQWYVVMENDEIIGGTGVIENDFHERRDLTPNICALYVEEKHRCKGIAGKLLAFVCSDMSRLGIDTLYLVTDHTAFYERYGWKFLCMVQEEGTPDMIRMYIHKN
ncbi:MAG: GNAT family N-acetyltransferase [Clostridiales bacterium]|nr:GNAT family N-acetyltransferase [Clostridiales bacterium]